MRACLRAHVFQPTSTLTFGARVVPVHSAVACMFCPQPQPAIARATPALLWRGRRRALRPHWRPEGLGLPMPPPSVPLHGPPLQCPVQLQREALRPLGLCPLLVPLTPNHRHVLPLEPTVWAHGTDMQRVSSPPLPVDGSNPHPLGCRWVGPG
uniref:Uncharacterized protein n=1 Tax=Eutreptiella gymnastica TaxID=73025 RepID=A0A7S4LGX8_9EUGL